MAKSEIATERTRLSIPFDDRQRAIRAAGKLADGSNALDYVKEEKVWYAQPGANLSRLKEWIFDPNKVIEEPPTDIQAIEDEFTAWLEERGAIIKDPIEFDGQKHYVDTVDGKAGSRKGCMPPFWMADLQGGTGTIRTVVKFRNGYLPAQPLTLNKWPCSVLMLRQGVNKELQRKRISLIRPLTG